MEPLINIVWNQKLTVLSVVFAFLFSFLEFKNVLNKRFLWSLQNWSLCIVDVKLLKTEILQKLLCVEK